MPEETIPAVETAPATPSLPKPGPPWGYTELGLTVVSFVGALFICSPLGMLLVRTAGWFPGMSPQDVATKPLFFVPVQLAAYLLTFLVVRLVITQRAGEPFWQAIRWRMPARQLVVLYALTGVVLALTVLILSAFLPFPKHVPMQEYFREMRSAYAMMAFGLLVAPVAEELFFRGLALPVLMRSMGQTAAVIVTGMCFSLMHQGQLARAWAPLLLLFGVGMALTLIRVRSGSVAASWITHVAYNATLFATLLLNSRGFRDLAR